MCNCELMQRKIKCIWGKLRVRGNVTVSSHFASESHMTQPQSCNPNKSDNGHCCYPTTKKNISYLFWHSFFCICKLCWKYFYSHSLYTGILPSLVLDIFPNLSNYWHYELSMKFALKKCNWVSIIVITRRSLASLKSRQLRHENIKQGAFGQSPSWKTTQHTTNC
jgi:hypothetical protein